MPAIEYQITPSDLDGHRYSVDLFIREPNPDGQRIQLPSWIPGSYMIRDFSKNIEKIQAFTQDSKNRLAPISLKKINNSTWELPVVKSSVLIRLSAYAFDTSVRTAYLDQYRGFFNPSSICLQVLGQAHLPCHVVVNKPKASRSAINLDSWEVQTSLSKKSTNAQGFGSYLAANYDELIDHPFALGHFTKISWKSCGVSHRMAIQGHVEKIDSLRLLHDLQILCEKHIQFFDPQKKRAPFKEYLFLVNAVGQGYGGLEHRSSTALLCNRSDLPYASNQTVKNSRKINKNRTLPNQKSYEDFLGLCSHEYFHAWMVKKVQPAAFQPYTLDRKNYTQLLWLFEGFTSYYDDLQMFRSGLIDKNTYLNRILDTWNMVLRSPGRHIQSVADSSFDAWTKYYQSDENTPNAVVSYYAKGSLIALALDLLIREFSHHKKSLDDVMRALWKKHGAYGNQPGIGLKENKIQNDFSNIVIETIGSSFQKSWSNFYRQYIVGTKDIPLEELLGRFGIQLKAHEFGHAENAKAILGIRTANSDGWLKVTHVLDGGTAQKAGIAPGDFIVSLNNERVTPARWDALLKLSFGSKAKISIFRHDVLVHLEVSLHGSHWIQYQIDA
jgi:predicted metalloprotease with PDZ domain